MIYVNHHVYDLHNVPNALFLNNDIDDYSCNFHFSMHIFIPVINIRYSKKLFHWIIFKNIYIFFNCTIKIFEHYLNI